MGKGKVRTGSGDVDATWTFRPAFLFSLLRELRSRRWDAAVDLNTAESATSGLLTRWADAAARVSFDKPHGEMFYDVLLPSDEKAHRAAEALKAAAWLGAEVSDASYRIYPGSEDEAEALRALTSLGWREGEFWVAAHPGNMKKFDNRWPEEKFAQLLDRLSNHREVKVLLLKGPGEEPLIESVLARMRSRPPVAPALPILPTAALLKHVKLVLCNSTSTLHLAAAVGTATLSFLSGYSAACWRAPGPQHVALVGSSWESCRDIPVEEAWKALGGIL